MKVICAPDGFKGSVDAVQAAEALAAGAEAAGAAEVDRCPIADGGEGTVAALVTARDGELRQTEVTGPLGEPLEANWGWIDEGQTAVIEMAAAAGLVHVPADQRDPTRTTTFGVGQLIQAALEAGARRIIVGSGGSGTTDGGAGLAQALGVTFEGGQRPMTGGALNDLQRVDLSTREARLQDVEITVAADVTNPLTGDNGAAAIYGPQKGADPAQVDQLDAGLGRLASLSKSRSDEPGDGAAGGLGFGLRVFCGAKLTHGIDMVLEALRFDERAAGADLVLTGEGQMDSQSLQGKACIGLARAAARHRVPVAALIGAAGEGVDAVYDHGIAAYFSICDRPMTIETAQQEARSLIERAACNATRCYLAGRGTG